MLKFTFNSTICQEDFKCTFCHSLGRVRTCWANWVLAPSTMGKICTCKANHLPRRQTALKGTLGQRTANTQGCGSSLACEIISITASSSCHGNGCKGWIGNWSSANCLRYLAARLVASEPPSNCSKTFASSFHPCVISGFKPRRPISPIIFCLLVSNSHSMGSTN